MEAYLAAVTRLNAAVPGPYYFSQEAALRTLCSHEYDALAATHSMSVSLGADKALDADSPVSAATSIVRRP